MGLDPMTMDVVMCERHSGAQPGGGICAICLQERLILLWRGEGNCNWDMEEFSVTPPPGACKTPTPEPSPVVMVDEEEPAEEEMEMEMEMEEEDGTRAGCFPVLFRVRNLQQRRDEEGSTSHSLQEGREKIDRSEHNQFSCELKSIVKELAALHEKKKKKLAKRRGPGSDTGCISGRRQPHEEVAADVSQGPVTDIGDAVNADMHAVPKAKASIVEDEEDATRYSSKAMCFSTLWPAIVNMKWARVLVSPIMSSNKIAPTKSDLLSKLVNGLPKAAATATATATAAAAAEEPREESGRNCETSGSNDLDRSTVGHQQAHDDVLSSQALLPPRYVQPAADEDGTVLEIDKETKLRMEASRITVMTWLQSLPSPKAVHLEHNSNRNNNNHKGVIPDDLSLGNGVLEMCDEEEVEFDCQSQEANENAIADPVEFMTSFGKFLRTSSQVYAPTRMVDIEIAAQ